MSVSTLLIGTYFFVMQKRCSRFSYRKIKRMRYNYTAEDYGGFEKVGTLPHELPTVDRQIILTIKNPTKIFLSRNIYEKHTNT